MKSSKKIILILLYVLLSSFIGGFFAGFQSILHPIDVTSYSPLNYILLNSFLFIPAILFSLFYIFTISKILKSDIAPSPGLWAGTIFGVVLSVTLLAYSLNIEITESYKIEGGEKSGSFEGTASGLEKLWLNSFYLFLILFAFLSPIIDFFYLRSKKIRINTKSFFLLLGLSISYYLLIFIWRIVLFYAVNIFLFFALWS